MIDEKKLISAFAENDLYLPEVVERLIKSQPKIGGWIPCSERLPDAKNNVLICQNDGYVSVGYYSQEKFLDLYSYPFNEVIAWQPLPEAYNG